MKISCYKLSFLVLFLVISCKKNTNEIKKQDSSTNSVTSKYIKKTLTIQIPDSVLYASLQSQVVKVNNNSLLVRKRNGTGDEGIDIIDLTSKKYLKSIIFDVEGPNGIGRLNSFFYKNNDSILSIPPFFRQVLC